MSMCISMKLAVLLINELHRNVYWMIDMLTQINDNWWTLYRKRVNGDEKEELKIENRVNKKIIKKEAENKNHSHIGSRRFM